MGQKLRNEDFLHLADSIEKWEPNSLPKTPLCIVISELEKSISLPVPTVVVVYGW